MKFDVYVTDYYEAEIEAETYEDCESLVKELDYEDFHRFFHLVTSDTEILEQDGEEVS